MDTNKLGLTIKTLRKREGMTQHSLASALGVTDKAVSKWERGIGAPDISLVNRLSQILNIDVDNLLAGNIAYLQTGWVGIVDFISFETNISLSAEVYGKPIVYFFLSYFLLAGINEVYVECNEKDEEALKAIVKDGSRLGMTIHYNEKTKHDGMKCMVISGPIFLYGPNLTKYFQRAMSQKQSRVALVIPNNMGDLCLNSKGQISDISRNKQKYKILPVSFVTKYSANQTYEIMGKGMIGIDIVDYDAILDISNLMRIVNRASGERVYCIEEISYKRGFINSDTLVKLAEGDEYLLELVNDKSVDETD